MVDALAAGTHPNSKNYLSFYSSELRGIVTDPALMVLSIDDHLVHRGHAVFDTAIITEVCVSNTCFAYCHYCKANFAPVHCGTDEKA